MGTRADFYIGIGPDAQWLGSIAWDGQPSSFRHILASKNEAMYESRVKRMFAGRDDSTLPHQGWPWPWNDSRTTDYAYAFHDGIVWTHGYGPNDESQCWRRRGRQDQPSRFADMSKTRNIAMGTSRDSIMIVRVR